jgi:hypothetical protein
MAQRLGNNEYGSNVSGMRNHNAGRMLRNKSRAKLVRIASSHSIRQSKYQHECIIHKRVRMV